MVKVTLVNPNLFKLAAKHLGDGLKWDRIAKANNLIDPLPQGLFTIAIPEISTVYRDTLTLK